MNKPYGRLRTYTTNTRLNKAFSDKEKLLQRGWFFKFTKPKRIKR